MSFNNTLSQIVFALNEGARRNLCALLPPKVISNIKLPSVERASWEEDMLVQLNYIDSVSDEIVRAELENDMGGGEGFIRLCAVVLAKAGSPTIGGAFLYALPLHIQVPVLHGLLTRSSLTCLRGLEGPQLEFVEWVRLQLEANERWGGQWAADIMRTGSGRSIQCLLRELDGRDSSSTLILQQHLFQFSDLLSLSSRDLQLVLSSESNEHIALALQGVSEEQADQVLTQVSPRRRRLIHEEVERYVDADSKEITEAYQAIISTARLLQQQNRITTFRSGIYRISGSAPGETTEIDAKEREVPDGPIEVSTKRPTSPPRKLTISHKWFGLGIVVGLPLLWFSIKSDFNTGELEKKSEGGKQQWIVGGTMKADTQIQNADAQVDWFKGRDKGKPLGNGVPGVTVSGNYRVESAQALAGTDSTGRVLFLRLGEVQAHIMQDNFSIQTPLIRVEGPIGTRYQVRVVLDATSEVWVEDGWVEVESVIKPGNSVRMGAGQVRKFTHSHW